MLLVFRNLSKLGICRELVRTTYKLLLTREIVWIRL